MKALLIIIFILISLVLKAQQIPQFSQRMIDEIVFNPAAVGTKDYPEIILHHRSQWVSFDNAPITQALSYNGRIAKEKMGLGGFILNDITGPTRRFSLNLIYTYQVKFEKFNMSLGLAGNIIQYGVDGSKITLHENNDYIIAEKLSDKVIKPDASCGLYFYNEKFYAGISALQLLQSQAKLSFDKDHEAKVPLIQHYYLTSGFNIKINKKTFFQPSILFSSTLGSPSQIDLNLKMMHQNKIFYGITYRYNDAVVILAGFKIKDMFIVSYSYDIVISKLRTYNSGSHEIILAFDLKQGKSKKSKTKI